MSADTKPSTPWLCNPEALEPATGNYFVSTYPPFSCWSAEELPAWERVLAVPAAADPFGLYVHIPFCEKRCDYCYYLSYDDRGAEIDRCLEGLVRELELYAACPYLHQRQLGFVYFGGGTPSLLSAPRIRRLLEGLQERFPWRAVDEVTFECAPKSVTADKLEVLRQAGVTRISLGVQELDDRILTLNGRVHLVRDVERAWELIGRLDFPVRNIDLIAGLPGQTDASFVSSVARVIDLAPESVTIYQLEIPFNTPLYRGLRGEDLAEDPVGWDAKRSRLREGFVRLEAAGYTIRSGYTALRDPIRHPFVYQDEQYRGADLLGIGVSSFSYLGGVHQQNLVDLDRYLEHLADGRLPLWRAHRLDADEQLVRQVVLQLKLGAVDSSRIRAQFGVEVAERFAAPLAELLAAGWLESGEESIRLTREGLLRVDRLLPSFYLSRHQGVRYT